MYLHVLKFKELYTSFKKSILLYDALKSQKITLYPITIIICKLSNYTKEHLGPALGQGKREASGILITIFPYGVNEYSWFINFLIIYFMHNAN